KALEVRPTVPAVVHHAAVTVANVIPEGTHWDHGKIVDAQGKDVSDTAINKANGGNGLSEMQKPLSFVPGRGNEEHMGDAGQRMKQDAFIDFNMHYQPTGKPEIDQTKIGLYFPKAGQEVRHQIYHQLQSFGPVTYYVAGKQFDSAETPRS